MARSLTVALLLVATPVFAEVRLPKLIGSHMVLQRNTDVRVWGWGDAGETVTITTDWLDGKTTTTADADGRWQAIIKTGEAGGPHAITISGENRIALTDILFGEVWLASGQSNMEMPLVPVSGAYTGIGDFQKEIADADFERIRLFQVGNFSSKEPLDDVETGISMYGIPPSPCRWEVCTPATVPTFASTAYFFARALHRDLDVPIGIIDASWGGTAAEAWTPASGLEQLGLTSDLQQAATRPQQPDQKVPTRLYNGMIHPLRNCRIKGAIWYQGEGNAWRADTYRALFTTMIGGWRKAFADEFPFYFVQIAPFNYQDVNAAYLREAQLQALSVPCTGMVVTMDIGDLADIHPKNKQEVGRRLALWALANDYERAIEYSGPILAEAKFQNGSVRITFEHATDGLVTRDGAPPSHLEVAGDDRTFHPATAVIEGNELVVSSAAVPNPQAVRYAFTSQAMPNLMNQTGLPASPFRTDSW